MTQASISALSTGASVTWHTVLHSAPPRALLSTAGTGQSYPQQYTCSRLVSCTCLQVSEHSRGSGYSRIMSSFWWKHCPDLNPFPLSARQGVYSGVASLSVRCQQFSMHTSLESSRDCIRLSVPSLFLTETSSTFSHHPSALQTEKSLQATRTQLARRLTNTLGDVPRNKEMQASLGDWWRVYPKSQLVRITSPMFPDISGTTFAGNYENLKKQHSPC